MCTSSAWTRSPQVGIILAGKATSTSNRQKRARETDLSGWTDLKIALKAVSKGSKISGMNINVLWQEKVNISASIFDGSKGFSDPHRMKPVLIHKFMFLQVSKPKVQSSVSQLPSPHLQATLSENISTGVYFLYPAEQQSSKWFWNSHVYPSNPYQYSVTCMWISGPYLTQGTLSLWKRIPNITVHKHSLLLQQAWGPRGSLQSTNDFHESVYSGLYNSNPACLCC